MPYATEPDLVLAAGGAERFLSLTDWDGDGDSDPEVVAAAQAYADSKIHEYISNRYELPIQNPSEQLQQLAADLAVWWIKSKRGELALSDVASLEQEERIRTLEAYRAGTLRPDTPTALPSTAGRSAVIENVSDVSRDKTRGMW